MSPYLILKEVQELVEGEGVGAAVVCEAVFHGPVQEEGLPNLPGQLLGTQYNIRGRSIKQPNSS